MWQKLHAFLQVAELNSFAKAAKNLGMSTPTLTRYIQELEKEYQCVLFKRSTRHVHLTAAGEEFENYARELLTLKQQAYSTLHQQEQTIEGTIKIGLPNSILIDFAKRAAPTLQQHHPKLQLQLIQGNHLANLLSDRFDMVIHCGELPNVNYYYEKITDWKKVLCASPAYLKQHGRPRSLAALAQHQLIDHADNHTHAWPLTKNGKVIELAVQSRLSANTSLAIKELALQDLGIIYLPSFSIHDALQDGTLIPLLKNNWQPPLPMYAVYPVRKQHSANIRTVIEAMRGLYK